MAMGDVISIQEAHRTRRRQRESLLNARCRTLIAQGLDAWWSAYVRGDAADRHVCRRRIHMLGELLAYADRLP
jgi:hypothetical protein